MISSLGSFLGFWMPKEGKEAKGRAQFFKEAFACEERSFWSLEMGFDA
jgi:hypothetical protein